jgi:hypothetical protein
MSSSLFHNLPITKEKVNSVIAKLKTNLRRNPTEDEIATDLNISKEELRRFKLPSSETRYYGSSLAEHNRPSGPVFMDPLRYERNLHGYETPTGLLYNDPKRIAALSILQGKKGGQITRNLKKNKNKHKKTSSRQRRHKYGKKNKKSMKRK